MFRIKFFFNAGTLRRKAGGEAAQTAADPLQHPDLAAMSMGELADLPLTPEHLGRDLAAESAGGAAAGADLRPFRSPARFARPAAPACAPGGLTAAESAKPRHRRRPPSRTW